MAKKGLKRGLEHLFEDNDNALLINDEDKKNIQYIPLDDISPNPYQPRKDFNDTKIEELSKSIKDNGVLQPILLRKNIIGYEIISGERRFRAAKRAGLKEIPAIIKELDDTQMMEIAVIENVQREDLSVVEEANSYKKLIDELDYTQEKLAKRLGISRSHIANLVRITNLDEEMLDSLSNNEISLGHAKILVGIEDDSVAKDVFNMVLSEKLNVRQTEGLVKERTYKKGPSSKSSVKKKKKSRFSKIEELMIDKLGTKVQITGDGKGQIKISYDSDEDLERLIDLLKIIEE